MPHQMLATETVAQKATSMQSEVDSTFDLEDPELLKCAPQLDISVTDVINQLTGEKSSEPVPGPSVIQNRSIDFSPSKIRPLPKAPPRKESNRGGRKRKCAILTDTPEKEALEREFEEKMKMKQKQEDKEEKNGKGKGNGIGMATGKSTEKQKIYKVKKRVLNGESDSKTEDWFCLICGEEYSRSDGEEWLECLICKLRSHFKCVNTQYFDFPIEKTKNCYN